MLKRRGGYWHVSIAVRGQKPIRRSTGIKAEGKEPPQEAKEYHDKLAHESWRVSRLGEKPRKLWEQAVIEYLEHARKRSIQDDKEMLRWLDPHLKGCALDVIAGVGDDGYSKKWDAVLLEKRKEGVTDSRLNRYTALAGKILRDNGLLPKLRKYVEPEPRTVFLERGQAAAILAELPDWATAPFLFDLAVGLRKSNLLGLQWGWIKMAEKVIVLPASEFKQGSSPRIPLSSLAIDILRRQIGKHDEFVFVRDGKPITEDAWRWMWDKVKPEGVRFHDVRKTWASWLRQEGVSIGDIKAAGGWKTLAIVESTYAHVQPHHLVPQVEKLSATLHELDTHQRTAVPQVSAGKGI